MPDTKKLSPGSVGLSAGLSLLALLFYALQIATLADLAGSDPAGNAYAQAYGAIEIIFLWALLAVLVLIAYLKGEIAKPALAAAVILVPASCVVAFEALELLSRPHVSPFLWPLVIPALIPPLVVAYCFWALLPDMRAKIPARIAGGIVWGAVLVLCFAIVPLEQIRRAANEKIADALEKFDADYAGLPADAPLWDLVPFLETRNTTKQSEVLDRIRARDRRQSEAELMLDRGDFPLSYIGRSISRCRPRSATRCAPCCANASSRSSSRIPVPNPIATLPSRSGTPPTPWNGWLAMTAPAMRNRWPGKT